MILTRIERRKLIKCLHLKACSGDDRARQERDRIMGVCNVLDTCTVCGIPINTKHPGNGQCRMHFQRRVYMRPLLTAG